MSAQIINLADWKADRAPAGAPTEDRVLHELLLLAGEMGLNTAKYRIPSPPPPPRQPTILELIQEIADNYGIDIEAPFRKISDKGDA